MLHELPSVGCAVNYLIIPCGSTFRLTVFAINNTVIEFWISRFLELLFLCQMHISVFKCSFCLLKVTCSTIEFILQKERSPWFYHPSSSLHSPRILLWSFCCLWHLNGGKLPSGLLLGAPLCIVLWYKIKEQSVLLFLYGVETPIQT